MALPLIAKWAGARPARSATGVGRGPTVPARRPPGSAASSPTPSPRRRGAARRAREVVETRAPFFLHHGDVRVPAPEEGAPADDVERVDVAEAVDVGAGIEQRPRESLSARAAAQCSAVVLSPPSRASTSAPCSSRSRTMSRRPCWAAACSRGPARVGRVGSADARERGVEAQEPLRLVAVAADACGDERRDAGILSPLDLGLEGSPAGEPILARDGEQRVREPRLRVDAAEVE